MEALREHRFGVTMREWEAEQGRTHAGFFFARFAARAERNGKLVFMLPD